MLFHPDWHPAGSSSDCDSSRSSSESPKWLSLTVGCWSPSGDFATWRKVMGARPEDCEVREHVNRVLNKLLIFALSLVLFSPLMLRIVQPLTALLRQQSRTSSTRFCTALCHTCGHFYSCKTHVKCWFLVCILKLICASFLQLRVAAQNATACKSGAHLLSRVTLWAGFFTSHTASTQVGSSVLNCYSLSAAFSCGLKNFDQLRQQAKPHKNWSFPKIYFHAQALWLLYR